MNPSLVNPPKDEVQEFCDAQLQAAVLSPEFWNGLLRLPE
jgi:hypothetical protein